MPKTIAVVEDNEDNRMLLRAFLEDRFAILEFSNGADALEGFGAAVPDLVLMDISLPGMDGTQILSEMRQDDRLRSVPVIALTAHAMTGDRERFLEAGFDGYISKPILDDEALVGAIEELLR